MTKTQAAALALILAAGPALAAPKGVETPADVIHPNIHQNVTGGANANPNGANAGGGNLHGIANNPGKSGSRPNDDGVTGQANELETMHGGISSKNKQAR